MSDHAFRLHPCDARLLAGRRALVAGSSSGIGLGTAHELAAHGAAVALTYRGPKQHIVEAAAAEIEAAGGSATVVELDVTREDSVHAAFAQARQALGGLDLLVNNAGVEAPFALVDMPLEEWRRVIDINLTGTFLCAREAARIMRDDGARGTIVNVSSVHEVVPWKDFSHYCASKAGVRLFTATIANELAPLGIRVVAVAPGAIDTPINHDVLGDKDKRAAIEREIAMGRVGEVPEVARAIAWLASSEASYVTGATLFVDGGMTTFPNFV